ncbi:hypothetical protein RD792_011785 [Penstemon davidsonii]|uniref:Sodium/calcium exchanger membrane region domain-containing protein n=1 Tax=Penstemon davidsonii TaxID=160366 RepID=A0ABR0CV31_9LAMI|nr:hypothetical protein RD792_011785 [Penstemon davidsonii]
MASHQDHQEWLLENGNIKVLSKEMRHGRTAHNMSSSSLRKKSDLSLVSKVRVGFLRKFLANLQEVLLGTKLAILFLAIPFAIVAHSLNFGGGEEEDGDVVSDDESAVIGFWSAFVWLVLMTGVVALLSEYVVATIETASDTWGLSVSFISVILLPIVGNAAEHAGAIIFAFKNKYDISLGVALGSATQIAMFVVPLCVIVSWIMGINMDLNFGILETSSLAISILVTAFTLQDGTSHYLKGLVLLLCYLIIGACFFVFRAPLNSAT